MNFPIQTFNDLFEEVRARYHDRVLGQELNWEKIKQLTEEHARRKYYIVVNLEGGLKRLIEIQIYARFRASLVPKRILNRSVE